jgi:hypothetical protein
MSVLEDKYFIENIKPLSYREKRNTFNLLALSSINKRIKTLERQKNGWWCWFFGSKKVDEKIKGWNYTKDKISYNNTESVAKNAMTLFPLLTAGRNSRSEKKLVRLINFERKINNLGN